MRPNILRTILFNLRAFGIRKAMKMPVYVYGPIKVYNMGAIDIKCPIKRGMIKLGMNYDNTALPYTIWNNMGTIEVGGPLWIHHGCRLQNRGVVTFEGGDIISHECTMDIYESLRLGKHVSIGYRSEMTDSDVHYLVDIESRRINKNTKPIVIGSNNWFGSHTFVKKGTVTPDFTIVASPNAVLLKNYVGEIEPYSILAGSPARVIGKGKRRLFNYQKETLIREKINRDGFIILPEDTNIDEFCKLKEL